MAVTVGESAGKRGMDADANGSAAHLRAERPAWAFVARGVATALLCAARSRRRRRARRRRRQGLLLLLLGLLHRLLGVFRRLRLGALRGLLALRADRHLLRRRHLFGCHPRQVVLGVAVGAALGRAVLEG